MHLDTNTWYVKWFFWSCWLRDRTFRSSIVWQRHDDDSRLYYRDHGTNLCEFFRISLIGLLIIMIAASIYSYALYVFLVKPFLLFSVPVVGESIVFLVAIVAIIALFLGIVYAVATKIDSYCDRSPSFFGLVRSYIKSIKQQYCPIIQFASHEVSRHDHD